MGNKPTHRLSPLGEEAAPFELFTCENCGIHFLVDPQSEENMLRVTADGGRPLLDYTLEPVCPLDPAREDDVRQYSRMNEEGDSRTEYLEIKGPPSPWIREELVDRFIVKKERCWHSHDCCGCWFQAGDVKVEQKDGWTVYCKTFEKNI